MYIINALLLCALYSRSSQNTSYAIHFMLNQIYILYATHLQNISKSSFETLKTPFPYMERTISHLFLSSSFFVDIFDE